MKVLRPLQAQRGMDTPGPEDNLPVSAQAARCIPAGARGDLEVDAGAARGPAQLVLERPGQGRQQGQLAPTVEVFLPSPPASRLLLGLSVPIQLEGAGASPARHSGLCDPSRKLNSPHPAFC